MKLSFDLIKSADGWWTAEVEVGGKIYVGVKSKHWEKALWNVVKIIMLKIKL